MRLLHLLPALLLSASSCALFGAETRARSAERTAPPPADASDDDGAFDVPFEQPSGTLPDAVEAAPRVEQTPHADPARLQKDLDDRILQDERLKQDVVQLEVDWRDNVVVLDGIVSSQRAHDRLFELAQSLAPGSPIRNALVVRID